MRGLYAIVDPDACQGRDPVAVAEAVLRGGCAVLQLRAKQLDDEAFVRLATELRARCSAVGVPFVLNDRVHLVARVGAEAVHLGQGDTPIERARQQLGTGVRIGLSTHTLEQALDAERRGADVIGFGPVFSTATKADASPVVGLHALEGVCGHVRVPVVAIGGITRDNVADVARRGAQLAAAISALCGASDPASAAREMHASLLDAHRVTEHA